MGPEKSASGVNSAPSDWVQKRTEHKEGLGFRVVGEFKGSKLKWHFGFEGLRFKTKVAKS